jgi:acetyl/propionyl-CoA carboxylase alpha subunit/4'-phosphopantetheinyl transferase EntD
MSGAPHEFRRIAIVNRGEAAMRLIHAVRELNREHGTTMRTIALVTEPDRHALFAREADEVHDLGAAVGDGAEGRRVSYVDLERLEQALCVTRADAAWVGWGFVAEQPAFAQLCARLGVTFVGPSPAVMRLLGDKIAAKQLAERAGVPVVPWSGGAVHTPLEASVKARALGFPLLLKATAGGGGRGIREVHDEAELLAAFEPAAAEAAKAFGDGTLFLERRLTAARHVEVQVVADRHGAVWALGVRDCTIQRRHQKVLEESPSPILSTAEDTTLRAAAERLVRAACYESVGTVEFLFDTTTRTACFMEVNTRLQVEHPVTECTTGTDLVKLQLHVARGGRLDGEPPAVRGHAIEVRLNAEDPERAFAPAPGVVELLRLPGGPGIRVDRGVDEGDAVAPQFDSMIAKIIAHGRDRNEALARLRRALAETTVVIRGGVTNRAFLLGLLDRPEVARAEYDTGWLDRLAAEDEHLPRGGAEVAVLAAAVEVYEAETAIELRGFLASAARGRPTVRAEIGHRPKLRIRGTTHPAWVRRLGPQGYRVAVGSHAIDVRVEHAGPFERWLSVGGRRHRIVSLAESDAHRIEVDGVPHRIGRDDGGVVRAPAPSIVLSITVAPGDLVAAGDRVAVLEAMKTEMPIFAPVAGRVRSVLVTANVQVESGAPLLVLEPTEAERLEPIAAELRFDRLVVPAAHSADARRDALETLRQLILGFDVEPGDAKRLTADWMRLVERGRDDAELRRAEDELLALFADVHGLFEPRRVDDDPEGQELLSAQEYVLTYLRTLDAERGNLPAWFVERLRRALRHHGVDSLERSAALDEAWLRIARSHQRVQEQVALVMRILERRLDAGAGDRAAESGAVLDRLIALGSAAYPALGDLARELRYRWHDRPLFEQARSAVYAETETRLAALARDCVAGRADHVRWLVDCPQPLVGLLGPRLAAAPPPLRRTMLEVLARRYYRIRDLEQLLVRDAGGRSCAMAEYSFEGRRIHLLATHAPRAQLAEAARALAAPIAEIPADHDVVVDFFLFRDSTSESADAVAEAVRGVLQEVGFPRQLRRIVVVIATEGRGPRMGDVLHFTYRPQGDGYAEERVYRGLHPMMGKRLHLWRLRNFEIERLPSVEDVYLFRAVGRENAKDERLFALAEVRDLTPVRDEAGRVVQLPHLERMLSEALAAIRLNQATRPPERRLYWNRVLLYVWPPFSFTPDELDHMVRKLAPATAGLGLEKVVLRANVPDRVTGKLEDTILQVTNPGGQGFTITSHPPAETPIRALTEYAQKVVRLRRLGLTYPYEIVRMLTPPEGSAADFPPGDFVEHDLDAAGRLVPVTRPPGENAANLVVGVISNRTDRYPDGMTRVCLIGDPSRSMGALAEAECRRIIAALDLAETKRVPLEWFAVSAGARISMDSGTENMDWIAAVLRRLIEFTQAGGEVNVVVAGINVGAQPYWNAEATMLLHTRGILVMTPNGAMVLTGKRALEYSGGVSAEDNFGIGGYDRVMGPNGQAQYWARDLGDACRILFRHYEHTYVAPGERFPRRAPTADPAERDVRAATHGDGFARVGDIFSDQHNPGRKRPFRRPEGDGSDDRPGPPTPRALGGDARRGGRGGLGRTPGRRPRLPDRNRVATRSPARPRARRRPGAVDGGHALPAGFEEGGPGDQRGQRQSPGGGAREPLGVRRLTGIAARAAARVWCRDRPGGGQLRRADRVLRHLPLSRRRLCRVLANPQRVGRGRRGRGLVRIGDRRSARGRGGICGRGGGADPARSACRRVRDGSRCGRCPREGTAAGGTRRGVGHRVRGEARRGGPRVRRRPQRPSCPARGVASSHHTGGGAPPLPDRRGGAGNAADARGEAAAGGTAAGMSAVAPALRARTRPVAVCLVAAAEVPPGDLWLGEHERAVVAALRFPKRRTDWLRGRYAAKRAAASWLGRPSDAADLARVEVLAGDTGAPHLHCDGEPPLALSLSHSAGWALAAVAPPEVALGCDLELVETRSEAFLADYLTGHEQALVGAAEPWDRPRWASLIWCVKECALKALREGLRLDTRSVELMVRRGEAERGWFPVGARVVSDGQTFEGWWRPHGDLLACVLGAPGLEPPRTVA